MGWVFGMLRPGDEPGHKTFEVIRDLPNEVVDACRTAMDRLSKHEVDQRMFGMVQLNYLEFKAIIGRHLIFYTQSSAVTWEPRDALVDVNRSVLNFLNMMRTYLDHTEARLKREYRDDPGRAEQFKRDCSATYDAHFAYRFLCKLRNYCQHCGLPVGISLEDSRDPGTGQRKYEARVECDRDALLAEYDGWGAVVREELRRCAPKIALEPFMGRIVDYLATLNAGVSEVEEAGLQAAAAILQELLQETQGLQGNPYITSDYEDWDKGKIDVIRLPVDLITRFTS